ncbi:MAG: peptidylprolyl isomerase [Verrucomicrobiota bacterium]
MKSNFLASVLGIVFLASASGSFAAEPGDSAVKKRVPPTPPPVIEEKKVSANETNEVAIIKTTEGEMVVEFWPEVAPKTVENFKTLAKKGFYDGTAFHRVIKGFMIQGGDPYTKDAAKEEMWGNGDPGYKIKAEFNDRPHVRGVLSMARSNDPDSAGSQFFICHGSPSFLDHKYTTFGKLIKGDDVLEKIATTATHPPDRPDKRVGVESIKIVPASSVK